METPPDLTALSEKAAERLRAAIVAQGGPAEVTGTSVTLGFAELTARCVIIDAREQPGGFGVALAVEVGGDELPAPLRDVSGARAPTIDEAVEGAVQGWLAGLFVPLRDALGEAFVPYRYGVAQTDTRTGETIDWCVYESPLHLGGEEKVHEKLWDILKDPPLFGRAVQAGLLPPLAGDGLHWCKLGVVGEKGKTIRVEAAFDGQPWVGIEKLFQQFEWPSQGIQMFRQYWVLTSN